MFAGAGLCLQFPSDCAHVSTSNVFHEKYTLLQCVVKHPAYLKTKVKGNQSMPEKPVLLTGELGRIW